MTEGRKVPRGTLKRKEAIDTQPGELPASVSASATDFLVKKPNYTVSPDDPISGIKVGMS